jgi:hypothetical protein
MVLDDFIAEYPQIAAALIAITTADQVMGSPEAQAGDGLTSELSRACQHGGSLLEPLVGILGGHPRPDAEFHRFGLKAYERLGFSEDSRAFVGRLWAEAVESWDSGSRGTFLSLLLRDPHEVFEALDLAAEIFRRVVFEADEIFPWLMEAHGRVVNNMVQRGFWGCAEALCITSPDAAIDVCGAWLDIRPTPPGLTVIGHMVGWLRIAVHRRPPIGTRFRHLEGRLTAAGSPGWRAMYILSWTRGHDGFSITQDEALGIRDQYVVPESEEETAWCLLLNGVVQSDSAAWFWAYRELSTLARPTLAEAAKHWVALAALHGLAVAQVNDVVSPERWREVIGDLLPIASESPLWRLIHDTMAALAKKDGGALRLLIRLVAEKSARTWLNTLSNGDFRWFFRVIVEKGLAPAVAADLCFARGPTVRRIGLLVFDECCVKELDPGIVQSALPLQIELLLLEAQRHRIAYGPLARLHACLSKRVDEIQGTVSALFYDEVALQCMNTHEYRAALAIACPGHDYLQAILLDVGERLAVIVKAGVSPAFQMQAPGQRRGEQLYARRLAQEVSAGMKRHSTFLNLFPTINVLYGGREPRLFSREGQMSPPVQMQSSSSSVEVPRQDSIDPEGMTLRRFSAGVRVSELEPGAEHEDDKP